MGLKITPVSDVCGAEISGIDVTAPLAPEDVAAIEAAFNRHKVLVIKEQPMTARQLADFSANFGPLQAHVQTAYQHPEVPEVVQMTNKKADGTFDEVGAARGAAGSCPVMVRKASSKPPSAPSSVSSTTLSRVARVKWATPEGARAARVKYAA